MYEIAVKIALTEETCQYAHTKFNFSDGFVNNLIDLNCEVAAPPMPVPRREHDYVNDVVMNSNRDVFDMREYHPVSLLCWSVLNSKS